MTTTTTETATETKTMFVTCEGSKQDWKFGKGTYSCPTCLQSSKDLRVNLRVKDGKPIPPKVPSHKVEQEVPIKAAAAKQPGEKTATDFRREIDLAIITAAGELVEQHVPDKFRKEVAQLIANQLHHLSTPNLGWPASHLPKPDRSDWR